MTVMAKKVVKRTSLESRRPKPASPASPGKGGASVRSRNSPIGARPRWLCLAKPLSPDLLASYFRWCPPELAPRSETLETHRQIHGTLTVRIPTLSGLGPVYQLVGRAGYLAMEVATVIAGSDVQCLIGAAVAVNGERPGHEVDLSVLWRVFQPSYGPQFTPGPVGVPGPPTVASMNLAAALDRAASLAANEVAGGIVSSRRAGLMSDLERLSDHRDHVDSRRREARAGARGPDSEWKRLRGVAADIDARIAECEESLRRLEVQAASLTRRPLCSIAWRVLHAA